MKIENLKKHSSLPLIGVYFLYKNNQLVYIGQSTDILLRVRNHFKEKDFDSYSYFECELEKLNEVERFLIEKYTPKLNRCMNIRHKTERKKHRPVRVYNKEKNRSRYYYNVFDIKKKYPHVATDKIEDTFKNGYKSRYEDYLLIIY